MQKYVTLERMCQNRKTVLCYSDVRMNSHEKLLNTLQTDNSAKRTENNRKIFSCYNWASLFGVIRLFSCAGTKKYQIYSYIHIQIMT
jgi:hypothetical protein